MIPYLFQVYGPIYANCYGIAIALGIMLFTFCMNRDPKRARLINPNQLQNTIVLSILVGVLGGRLLWVLSNWPMPWRETIEIWEGGLSVLGAILGIVLIMPLYLRYLKVPVLPLLDLAAIYAPLMQALGRIGCFCAGCCYGLPTSLPWGVIYTHPDIHLPYKFCAIHPTQLYSSLIFLSIFGLMYWGLRKRLTKPGQLTSIYLILSSSERFMVDFWRADHEYFDQPAWQIFSIHQWISLGIILASAGYLIWRRFK